MNEWEKSIREKVNASGILSNGEWVYLIGVFQAANELDGVAKENERLQARGFDCLRELLESKTESERLQVLLDGRDQFIASIDKWNEFVASLNQQSEQPTEKP